MIRTKALCVAAILLVGTSASASPEEVARIQRAIKEQGLSWQAGETRISRLSPAERAHKRMPRFTIPPWVQLDSHPTRTGRPPLAGPLPPGISWHNYLGYDFFPAARDQGQCGDCWAFSIIGTLEGLISMRRSQASPTIDLSEQDLFDCCGASLSCDSGGFTWDIGTSGIGGEGFVVTTGVSTEACYPYVSGTSKSQGSCTAQSGACATKTRASDYDNVYDTLPSSNPLEWSDPPPYTMSQSVMDEIKTWLLDRPVGTSMRAYDDLDTYKGGIYQPINLTQGSGLHAVVIVGYDDAGGYWIVRNSWGADWGENGYFRVPYNVSSVGMFSYVLYYNEAGKVPLFCQLPASLALEGTAPVDLKIANCGASVLQWTGQLTPGWLQIADSTGASITSGAVVAAGTTYQVSSTQNLPAGGTGQLVLSGAANGPFTIPVTVSFMPPDAAMPGPDAAAPGLDAAALPGLDTGVVVTGEDASLIAAADGAIAVAGDGSVLARADGSTIGPGTDAGSAQGSAGGCGCGTNGSDLASGALLLAVLLALRSVRARSGFAAR